MRSIVAKKGTLSFSPGGGMEGIVRVEVIIKVEDSPPFGKTEPDGERDLELGSGECNGEVQSLLRDVPPVPGEKHSGLWRPPDAGL
jgi:hypothetical protein